MRARDALLESLTMGIARIFQGHYLTSDGRLTHFTRSELSCRDSCGVADMQEIAIDALEASRIKLGKPIYVTSGIRCQAHNAAVGGAPESQHLKGLAIDMKSDLDLFALYVTLVTYFRRVGMYSRSQGYFCHADMKMDGLKTWVKTDEGLMPMPDFLAHYDIDLERDPVNAILEAT